MILDRIEKSECFGIDISIVKEYPLLEGPKKTIKRLDAGSSWNLGNPVTINADPFLFVYKDRLYLFYEDMHFKTTGGAIKMISTNDLKHWTKPVFITNEPKLHFSFPFVFEDDGEVYMIPETGWIGEIRLYKAENHDLTNFKLDTVLFKRNKKSNNIIFDYADTIVLKYSGLYYLFTSTLDTHGYKLNLYVSDNLRGPYRSHPASPVCHNLKYGRNAGSIIKKDGQLYRPAQDCTTVYGGQVNLQRITKISETEYEEVSVKDGVLPTDDTFYSQGGHQLNFVHYKGKIIVATDAKRDRAFYGTRIFHKILRMFGFSNVGL